MLEINAPDVLAEVEAAFRRYEQALVGNDVAVLTELFWHSPLTVRYGIAENLVGWDAISGLPPGAAGGRPRPRPDGTVITTYGRDFATASTEYRRKQSGRRGRQSQTWLRTPDGWRVVAAHVSLLPE